MKRHTEKSTKHWFSIYQLVERYLLEQSQDAEPGADEQLERLSLPSVSSTLQAFVEGSTLGQFHTRLAMLLSFHCHLLLVPSQPGRGGSAHQRSHCCRRQIIWSSDSGLYLPVQRCVSLGSGGIDGFIDLRARQGSLSAGLTDHINVVCLFVCLFL